MPVVKIIPSKSKIRHVETYLKNPNKTKTELHFGNLCDHENVTQSFTQWNQCFALKLNKRTYYHMIISFHPEDNVTAEDCMRIAQEVCERTKIKDYPYFGVVHTDTDHMHNHIVINNSSIYGKSYQSTRDSTRELKKIANEICEREGLTHSVLDVDKKAKERLTTAETQMILKKKQMPWKEELRYQIQEVVQCAQSIEDFKKCLKERYGVTVSENKKREFRYHSPGVEKPCPARRLGDLYLKESIKNQIESKGIRRGRGARK